MKSIKTLSKIILYTLLSFSLLGFLGKQFILFDIFSHFRIQYIFIFLIPLLVNLFDRNKWGIFFSVIGMGLNAFIVAPHFKSTDVQNLNSDSLTILHANVWSQNLNDSAVVNFLTSEQPDVIVIEELTPFWLEHLKFLNSAYPYHIEKAEDSNFGIGLWSKYPIENLRLEFLGSSNKASILGTLIKENRRLDIIATHPYPPATLNQFKMRISQFNALNEIVNNTTNELVLVGDLNAVPFSPVYNILMESNKLTNASRKGYQTTWPVYFKPLSLCLDHCLVSQGVTVLSHEVGKNIGSDHLPLIIKIGF